ncbi:ABC transporter ATP-binding protein [Thermaerobacter composti]|uniref:ABC transporter ATP-binding protein n=1 Tax=Thermaerobacter composti TaxID=554949 RepID=A0ABZ0QS66_9FIRM|nr:ABC transporter ATP-binding protein [Thermaerobacter composti]WPD20311.1 ABC transporter ATP-binding protein [Thermaerobacter composti]
MGEATVLSLHNVSKRFGELRALDEVSLNVEFGERRAIIGPNGAGKSTLFNVIAGELRPSAGKVVFQGRDITNLPTHQRAIIGIGRTFQATTLFPKLTVIENVILALQAMSRVRLQCLRHRAHYRELEEQAEKSLTEIGLVSKAHVPVGHLSYGEQRQIEVLLSIVHRPKLLLLDEPAAGLSPGDVPLVLDILRRVPRETTIILVEHDMNVVFELVDYITVLHHGKVVATGTPQEIRENDYVQEIYLGGRYEPAASGRCPHLLW